MCDKLKKSYKYYSHCDFLYLQYGFGTFRQFKLSLYVLSLKTAKLQLMMKTSSSYSTVVFKGKTCFFKPGNK